MPRKLSVFNLTTLDGFFEGTHREIDWHNVDGEFNQFAEQYTIEADILLFGRKTYEMMVRWWPTQEAITSDPIIANIMNSKPKIVFSRTLTKVDWNNTTLIQKNIANEVSRLKQQPGNKLMLLGSSDVAVELMRHHLIDEFNFMINPLLLGNGKLIYQGISEPYPLKLIQSKIFKSGNVLLTYIPQPQHS